VVTLEELATKGSKRYAAKIERMRRSYRGAKDRAISHYDALPFGPTRKANYKAAWEVMPDNYDLVVKPGLEKKWAENWTAKMKE
jgi:hypothetical protein